MNDFLELNFDTEVEAVEVVEVEAKAIMTNDEYHAHKALGSTNLKHILENPYAFAMGIEMERTPAMILGSAIHCFVLEPHLFNDDYIVCPNYDGRTREGKAIKAEYEAKSGGRTILKEEDFEIVKSCAQSIRDNQSLFFTNGMAEVPFFSEVDGIPTKCKPDYYIENFLGDGVGVVVDIKKCVDASEHGFAKACRNLGYFISAAHYLDTLRSLGKPADRFVFVCVEDKYPFMTAVYELSDKYLNRGREKIAEAFEIYKRIDEYNTNVYKKIDSKNEINPVIMLEG